jgi:hypothetical protein
MGQAAELESVRQRLNTISDSLNKIPPPGYPLSKEQLKEAGVRHEAIQQHLKLGEESLNRAQTLSESEWGIYSRIIELKMSELQRILDAANAAVEKRKSETASTKSRDSRPDKSANRPKERRNSAAGEQPSLQPPSSTAQPPQSE